MHPYDIIFVGLITNVIGAVILAKGFMFKQPRDAHFETMMVPSFNPHFLKSALLQRVEAQIGAAFLVLGFMLQIWGNLHGGIAASRPGYIDSTSSVLLVVLLAAIAAAAVLSGVSACARAKFYRVFFRNYTPAWALTPQPNDHTYYDRISALLDLRRRRGELDNQFLERLQQRDAVLGQRYREAAEDARAE